MQSAAIIYRRLMQIGKRVCGLVKALAELSPSLIATINICGGFWVAAPQC